MHVYFFFFAKGCTFISTRNREEKKIQEKIVIFRFPKQIKQIHIPKIFHSQNIHLNLIFHYSKREHTWQHHMLSHFPIFLSKKSTEEKAGKSRILKPYICISTFDSTLRFSPKPLYKRKRNKVQLLEEPHVPHVDHLFL